MPETHLQPRTLDGTRHPGCAREIGERALRPGCQRLESAPLSLPRLCLVALLDVRPEQSRDLRASPLPGDGRARSAEQ